MYTILLHFHSFARYILLGLMMAVIYYSFLGYNAKRLSSEKAKKISSIAMISLHSMVFVGIILYWLSPKVSFNVDTMKHALSRFFVLEHPLMMLLVAVMVTLGHVYAKNKRTKRAHRTLFWSYLTALVLLFIAIPWPFRAFIGGAWL